MGSCDVKFPIRLEGLAYAHGYFATVSMYGLLCALTRDEYRLVNPFEDVVDHANTAKLLQVRS